MLDRQLIKRDVVPRAENRSLQFLPPAGYRLAGPRINEIEGIALEDGRGEFHRAHRLPGCVAPAERPEIRVFHRLDPERDTVDAGRAEAAQTLRLDAGRIGLEGNLGIWRHRPM